jgi:hypothetical protein
MELLIKFWKLLDGKKRTIASVYWMILIPSMLVVWPDGYPQGFPLTFYKCVTILGLILTSIGLGHASVKTFSANKQQVQDETPAIEQETQQIEPKVESN